MMVDGKETVQQVFEAIEHAEMFLIGVGTECMPVREQTTVLREPFLADCEKSRFYEELPEEHEVLRAYRRLSELIGAKPYFVVTLNTDDLIYRAGFEADLVVAPCGSMRKLQCTEHIVEAAKIRDEILTQMQGGAKECEDGWQALAVCPQCGRRLGFHTIKNPDYLEEGYLPQWNKYMKWLSCTLNRRLCILELGVDFEYPQVIRFPFEKTAYFNQKSKFIRINKKFPQLAEKLSVQGINIRENPIDFLNRN
ncbi:hypothetical protein D7Y05_14790 [bacterium 1XD42-54]|nr:hypothetical protein D7Y05_14790 [bacterium 1XD42-54]